MATSMDRLTRKPVSVTDWRLQRCKNDAKNIRAFGAERSISSARGHNSAGMTVPGPRDSSSSGGARAVPTRNACRGVASGVPAGEAAANGGMGDLLPAGNQSGPLTPFWNDPDDNLRTMRGVIFGIGIGFAMYGIGALIVLSVWPR